MSKALKAAIEGNDPTAVRGTIKEVNDLNRKLPGSNVPLLYAAEKGADKVLEVLIEAGAVAGNKNTFPGITPFSFAAAYRQFGVMKRLLELKQASDEAVQFVLENASAEGKSDVLEFILQQVKPCITLELFRHASASSKAPELLELLLAKGGIVNARYETVDAAMVTPLHELVETGKVPVIQSLVKCGAEANARDSLGRTPLMVLASNLAGVE